MEADEEEPSLHFLSTQIQARHEDHEQREKTLSKLSKFKHALETVAPPQLKVVKKKKRSVARLKKEKPISSLSAFVCETLGSKKEVNTKKILDFFTGDESKVDSILGKVERGSNKDHHTENLISESEWKSLLEGIQLRFPSFSQRHKKNLKSITRKIEELQKWEQTPEATQNLESMWSQASRQLSDNLSAEDVKWLYDLDDEHLDNTTFEGPESSLQMAPAVLTLSQVFADSQQLENESVISDSEPECDLIGELLRDTPLEPAQRIEKDEIFSNQQMDAPDSVDVLTSIQFASTFPKESESPYSENQEIVSSPLKQPKADSGPWPKSLVITSSPIPESPISQEVFLTANAHSSTVNSPAGGSPSKDESYVSRSTIAFHGTFLLVPPLLGIILKTLQQESEGDVIPDSEDEEDVSIIEITRERCSSAASVLQVPSSPGQDLPPVLHPGDAQSV